MSKYILSIDIGTSGAKTVLFDDNFNIIANSSQQYETKYPHTGWAEQNPDSWWKALIDTRPPVPPPVPPIHRFIGLPCFISYYLTKQSASLETNATAKSMQK